MCDFHSIVVRRDGAVAHVASNSHSEAVNAAGWRENDSMADKRGPFFVECEWNGQGVFPGVDKITRGEFNEKQRKVIELHYGNLALLLNEPAVNGERMLTGKGCFSDEGYADLRWKTLLHDACPKPLSDKLAITLLHAQGEVVKSLHPKITGIAGNFSITEGYKVTAPVLAKCGYVYVSENATFTAPVLAECGNVDVHKKGGFTAPKLKANTK